MSHLVKKAKPKVKNSKEGSISFQKIVSEIALGGYDPETGELLFGEGKKVSSSVGNIREIVSIIGHMVYHDLQHVSNFEGGERGIIATLYRIGLKRHHKKKTI